MKNKSQMEIMGLAIIIILVALAMLFVVQFVVLRQPSDIRKTFTHKELASNTVNTLLSTTTDCRELPVSQLLKDCIEGPFIDCDPPCIFDAEANTMTCPKESGLTSCDHAEMLTQQILENTLEEWNKDYYLTIKTENINVIPAFGSACPGEKITSSPCCILPTGAGPMIVNLDICG